MFGSRARGDARPNSDYDFVFWLEDTKRSDWIRLNAEVDDRAISLLPIDLVVYDELSAAYHANIEREGVLIYAKAGA
jgi:predicted nucleotidyltransferase